jgi:PAS domain S-box-containing protein
MSPDNLDSCGVQPPPEALALENDELRRRLEEAEETIQAIRTGSVDALVVEELDGHRIYTLEGADRPYRLFVEEMQQGAATLHADGAIAWCNRQLGELLRTPSEKLPGRMLLEFVAPASRAVYANLLWQGQSRSGRQEAQLQRADGALVPVFLTFNALPLDSGAAIGALITDLTPQRHHEQLTAAHAALRESERKLALVTDRVPVFIAYCDTELRYKYVNERYARRFGLKPRDCVGKHIREIVGSRAFEACRKYVDIVLSGTAVEFETELIYDDIGAHYMHASYAPEYGEDGRVIGFVAAISDVSARKQTEDALRASEARARELYNAAEAARAAEEAAKLRAEAATRAKDDFMAALSHELRTPLSPALLITSALLEDPALPNHVRPDIEAVARGITLQARLVDDLLDLTRITSGKLRLDLQPVDAHKALHQALELVMPEIAEKRINVRLELPDGNPFIRADDVRMRQVFWNVFKNAVKFTPPGGSVSVRTFHPAGREDTLIAEVTDSGIGIAPEMLERIFESFAQESHGSAHRFGGLGLGLAISRRLVELQNGRIHARSAGRGLGATFSIEMPLSAYKPKTAVSEGAPREDIIPVSARRILLVEDHEMTRTTLTRLLEHRGHEVYPASTASEARALAATGKCDLVISDLGLPDCDGHTFMAAIRDNHGLPGIALSGYGAEEDHRRSRASGFFTHITKPVPIRVLEAAIAAAPPPPESAPNGSGF